MRSKRLTVFTLTAAAAAAALRYAHYAMGMDGRGLLVRFHWSVIALLALCAGFAAVLLLSLRRGDAPDHAPAALPAATGCLALAAAVVMTVLSSGKPQLPMELLLWGLGMVSATTLLGCAACHLLGRTPPALFYVALCLYITLQLIDRYRLWSAAPQLQDYGFYLTAHAALMLSAYHHAAFDAALSGHRPLWLSSLAAVFLSCAALPRCEEKLLLAAIALWAFGNLTVLPVRKRRIRPTTQVQQP